MLSVMILDAGNSIIKAKMARREDGEIAFMIGVERFRFSGVTHPKM
jgi:hypothetical protein